MEKVHLNDEFFSNDEMSEILWSKGYTLVREIGRGGFAKVFLVYSEQYKEHFAAKVFPRKCMNQRSLKSFDAEIQALQSLSDPHIVYCYNSFIEENYIFLIMEYCPFGSLETYIKEHGHFTRETCFYLFKQLLSTIQNVHSSGFAHLDLKPQNILIDRYGRLKLSDFGLSSCYDESYLSDNFCGSVQYMAPEILNKIPFNAFKVDIWSLGVTFYYMAEGYHPWKYHERMKLIKYFQNGYILSSDGMDHKLHKLLRHMLIIDQTKRFNAKELLETTVFHSVQNFPLGYPFIKHAKDTKLIHQSKSMIFKPQGPTRSKSMFSLKMLP